MGNNTPNILRKTTGLPALDMLRYVQVASHNLSPDYSAQSKLIALGIAQSEICAEIGSVFTIESGSFISQASIEGLGIEGRDTVRYDLSTQLLGKLASVGDYWNKRTRSRIILLGFKDIEVMTASSQPDNIADQVDLAILLESSRQGLVDIPCLAVSAMTRYVPCEDYIDF